MRGTRKATLWQYLRHPPAPVMALVFVAAVIAYATAGFLYFEKPNRPELQWADALWWCIVTMSTVGYGDYFPATFFGRLFVGFPAMLTGVAVLSYTLTQIAAFFIRNEALRRKGLAMQHLQGHIIVCNMPTVARFERLLAQIRSKPEFADAAVVVVDEHTAELDEGLARQRVRFVRGHPAREQPLHLASVQTARRAMVLAADPRNPESDNLTVATCLSLRHVAPALHVVAECVDADNIEVLRRTGCNSVVCVMDLAPGLLAHELYEPGVSRVLEELTTWDNEDNDLFIVPVSFSEGSRHTVADLHRWAVANGTILVGVKGSRGVVVNPAPDSLLQSGDAAVLIGRSRPAQVLLSGAA